MKTCFASVGLLVLIILLPWLGMAQGNWDEKDDMYFSKKDRARLMAQSAAESVYPGNSAYAANHNFGSPTLQSTIAGSPTLQPAKGTADDINNQYFITDYSLPKDTTYATVPTQMFGSNTPSLRNSPNVNIIFSYGGGFGYGRPYYGYNPYNDPFSPYYDPFLASRYGYYNNFGYNPWGHNRFYTGYGYVNNVCPYPTYGTTSYARNANTQVRYRNGRKVISGSRGSGRSSRRNTTIDNASDRPVKPIGKATKGGDNSYHRSSAGNKSTHSFNSRTRYSRPANRSTQRTTTQWNTSRPRSSGYSSGRSSYTTGGSRTRSSGTRPASGSSHSSGSRGRGRGN